GSNMGRCGAAAAAQNAYARFGGFAREERKIFRRRLGVNDAVALFFGEPGIRHAAHTHSVYTGEFAQNRQQRLRAQRAVRADYLYVFVLQHGGREERVHIPVGGAFLGVRQLRHNRQARERADGVNRQHQLIDIRKRFQDEEIDAAFFQRQRLFVKNIDDFIGFRMARLHTDAQRADGAGYEHFASGGLPRFTGDFHATAVQALNIFAEANGSKLEAVRAKGIRLDDLRAGFNVRLMHTENGFGFRGVQLVEAADCADGFVQQGTHGAIRNENGVLEPVVEILYFHWSLPCVLQPRGEKCG